MSRPDPKNPSPDKGRGRGGDLAPLFAALGDGTRLALLVTLCGGGPLSITRLSQQFDVSRQAVTKHLDVLAEAGLVRSRREGRERIWEFEPGRLAEVHQFLDQVSQQWDRSLARLKAFVEE
ncbi:MAG TPA: metalloregulator ArsR/SmtB family transcription factor [Gemmatimonadales bacterium]|nr:metalloregulator ArsR/SmtB family transcription factor [Gemmatimonadales bacterium]